MAITVLNRYGKGSLAGAVYIGRANPSKQLQGSPLGNPFRLIEAGGTYTRDQSVDAYAVWLRQQLAARNPAVCAEMNRLYKLAKDGDLALWCYCAPKRCHGDVVKQILEETLAARSNPC